MQAADSATPRARKLVVAALITRTEGVGGGGTGGTRAEGAADVGARGGEVLISQRREDQALPLFWEFPGGKIEPGEAPTAALVREIQEELGVDVHVGRVWDVLFHAYPEYDVYMLVYHCALVAGAVPRAVEVKEFAWVLPAQLRGYRILPADEALVRRLEVEGVPAPIAAVG